MFVHRNLVRAQRSAVSRKLFSGAVRPRELVSLRNSHGSPLQSRNFWGSVSKQPTQIPAKLLSQEQRANRALGNAAVQAEFYRELLEARYPRLVISRFETVGVARNAETDAYYSQALREVGRGIEAAQFDLSKQIDPGYVAARSASAQTGSNTRGTNGDPFHVIVSRPTRWIWISGAILIGALAGISYLSDRVISVFKEVGPELAGAKMDAIRPETSNVKFSDVQGVDEARQELEEIVEFLRDPAKFTGLGGKLPKGVLLTGPPGTGKTLLARAVAGEAGVPFFFMSGSEFDEVYVGVGAKRIRELFSTARAKAPAIVFIDELDAIGGKRNPKDQAYSKQTLNQLLVDLDGFNQSTGVVFIAATNFPEMLDKALTRPGRFDKHVNVGLPDVRGRAAILQHHMKKVEINPDVNVLNIARGTPGFSGADLSNLVNQAAIYASHKRAHSVTMNHLEWAKDKILLGSERKTMVMTEETRRNTAWHEAGHAIMALYTPGATPLYKATILPRGSALGITFQLPELDKYDQTKQELLARLDVAMGGRIAEEIVQGAENVTSGCASDLRAATSVAKAMVTSYGMSDKIGPVALSEQWNDWSASTRHLAEQEIRELLNESEIRTRQLLRARNTELERLALGLLEYETLDKEEIDSVVSGKKIGKDKLQTNPVVKADDIRDKRSRALAHSRDNGVASAAE